MCACIIIPGGTVVCDECAAHMVDALNDLLPNQVRPEDLPDVLTPTEHAGLTSLVNGWLDSLQHQQEVV